MANWHYLDGMASSQGLDLTAMPLSRLLNWVYYRMHENVAPRGTGKESPEARDVRLQHERLVASMEWPEEPGQTREDIDRARWGTGAEAQQAQAAMMGGMPALYIEEP